MRTVHENTRINFWWRYHEVLHTKDLPAFPKAAKSSCISPFTCTEISSKIWGALEKQMLGCHWASMSTLTSENNISSTYRIYEPSSYLHVHNLLALSLKDYPCTVNQFLNFPVNFHYSEFKLQHTQSKQWISMNIWRNIQTENCKQCTQTSIHVLVTSCSTF